MAQAKLPIGIQDFENIIINGYTYVDKTPLIYEIASLHNHYFLSRPRRFGKSLLVSTLHALFLGRRELFKDLWIEQSDWKWEEYPIIRLDMSTIYNRTPDRFELDLIRALNEIASQYNVKLTGVSAANHLQNLIKQLSVKQKVVVLIDEYDKPLVDRLDNLDIAKANREILREFYTILKAEGRHLRFTLLTGITKFSKVSLFSGINNLLDLTMLDQCSALLGYTREELVSYFSCEIGEIATKYGWSIEECYGQIKEWYNGYKFSREGDLIYNPFSVLNLLNSKVFISHWFETGTPLFLIDLMRKRQFDLSNLEQISVDDESFTSFDLEDLPTLPLLYQTGYLTIKTFLPQVNAYTLGFPNREVSQSFSKSLLTAFASSKVECSKLLIEISINLNTTPWAYSQFFEIIEKLLALIPYDLYMKHEKYFHTLFYLTIKLAGFPIGAEIHTQQGRTDAALKSKEKIIIFEFKLNESSEAALNQIKLKKYHEYFQDQEIPIYLVGVNFDGDKRVIQSWQVEKIEPKT